MKKENVFSQIKMRPKRQCDNVDNTFRTKYDKARSACDSARESYLGLKRTADSDSHAKASRDLAFAKSHLKTARAAVAKAVCAAEAGRRRVLLDEALAVGRAYQAYVQALAEAAKPLDDVLKQLADLAVRCSFRFFKEMTQWFGFK